MSLLKKQIVARFMEKIDRTGLKMFEDVFQHCWSQFFCLASIGPRILSKNILGTFYLPQLVFCISETFLTLILGVGHFWYHHAGDKKNLIRTKRIPRALLNQKMFLFFFAFNRT